MDNTYIGSDGLKYCKKCGKVRQARITVPLVGDRVVGIACDCVKAELESNARWEQLDEQERRKRICFADTNMHQWNFENSDGKNPNLEKAAKNYVNNFAEFKRQGKGLLLHGHVGTGKTYMAACIANALIESGYRAFMTNFTTLTNTIQGMWEGRQKYINGLNNYQLLVIDDLGAERKSDYMQEQVYNIIDARYRSGLPMIITTNLDINEIKKPVDIAYSRIYDRILERCHPIEVAGHSKRREKIKEQYHDTKQQLGI